MIDFEKIDLSQAERYHRYLRSCGERGCEYSLANLVMWGRQRAAFLEGYLVLFSQFEKRSIYPFPVGSGDIRPVLDAIIGDARQRGIVCRLSGLNAGECVRLEELYPGQFQFHPDRNSCDYVYKIEDLATLKGRSYQKKRNHLNKFRDNHPDCRVLALTAENAAAAQAMADDWFAARQAAEPDADLYLERRALKRAFANREALGLEGLLLEENGQFLAMTMGSLLSEDTFDIHFEKAREDVDGAYTAINQAFAAYLAEKYPRLRYLNREDDLGIPGLRKAKLSYHPDHLIVKFWARLREDDDAD